MIYSPSEILFGHKKERSTDSSYSMYELWKRNAERKEASQKILHIVYFTYIKCLEQENL